MLTNEFPRLQLKMFIDVLTSVIMVNDVEDYEQIFDKDPSTWSERASELVKIKKQKKDAQLLQVKKDEDAQLLQVKKDEDAHLLQLKKDEDAHLLKVKKDEDAHLLQLKKDEDERSSLE